MPGKWLPILILLTGLLYIFVIPEKSVLITILFKIIPMLLIIYYAYLNKKIGKDKYSIILLIGLFFCMLGDTFIVISFVMGLIAFLIGHLFYIGGFLTRWTFSWLRFSTIVLITIYAFLMGNKLVSSLQMNDIAYLIIPVILYICVISFMFWSANMTGNKFAIFGSTLFVISDSVLAWNKFINDVPYSDEIIMVTYYLAQFFIASSILAREKERAKYT